MFCNCCLLTYRNRRTDSPEGLFKYLASSVGKPVRSQKYAYAPMAQSIVSFLLLNASYKI